MASEREETSLLEFTDQPCKGDRSFLWTIMKTEEEESFDFTLLSGQSVWEGSLSLKDMKQQSDEIRMDLSPFIDNAKAAFLQDGESSTFQCTLSNSKKDSILLTWKKQSEDVKFKLGSLILKKCENSSSKICDILSDCVTRLNSLHSMKLENQRLTLERQNAIKKLEKCVQAKEELEKNLYSKFVAVLNSKKEKIRELENNDHEEQEIVEKDLESVKRKNDSDLLSISTKKVKSKRDETPPDLDSSLNLDIDQTEERNNPIVIRSRAITQTRKGASSKLILPTVSTNSSVNLQRKSSLRKSGSNKSSDNLDPDDLLDNF